MTYHLQTVQVEELLPMGNNPKKRAKETFVRKFKTGIVAKLIFVIKPGQPIEIDCHWSQRLTKTKIDKIFSEYQEWRNASADGFSQRHGIGRLLFIDL